MPYPFNDMQGGMFGPPGGTQNLGGPVMSDRELQMLLSQMRSQSPTGGALGGTLPMYDTPAPAGGPASPQGVPGLGTTGIDPNMIAQVGAAGGGLQGMDFGAQGDPMGGMQDAIMSFGRQKAEDERLRRLFAEMAAQGGGMGGGAVVPPTAANQAEGMRLTNMMNMPSSYPSGFGNSARRGFTP